MRYRTLEIRWHDSKPISTCDFQPVSFKKARPLQEKNFAGQNYRLATGGEDNHVRIWMVYPNILPSSLIDDSATREPAAPRPARVEYLATLSRHSAAVNVVRFSPNGEAIASAGDDGMIIIWAPSASPQTATYGSDLSPEDMQHEKEYWKPRTTFRCTTMQVYDLAWSPSGEYILAGSTDNCARVFSAMDGKCVHEIAEHNHYVQGVAWDPLNEYIATQSSDRSMHVYRISTKQGSFEAHAVGKNSRMPYHHSRTPSSQSRVKPFHRESTAASDAESVTTTMSEQHKEDSIAAPSSNQAPYAPLTPATSVASTPSASMFPPPPVDRPSSRRSSFSGSNAPSSPSHYARYGRSPSPMPPLPAIRALPSPSWSAVKLYGDESFTNFFRRLTFSPDGGLLITPAGQFEDPSIIPGSSKTKPEEPSRGRKNRPSINTSDPMNATSASSVYIYSRANFARPPIAQLPGHKKPSVAVRFSPILYELRHGVVGAGSSSEPKMVTVEKGEEGSLSVDITSSVPPVGTAQQLGLLSPQTEKVGNSSSIAAPAPLPAASVLPSTLSSPTELLKPPTPLTPKPSTPSMAPQSTSGSVFSLPYRMLYAVLTMDTIAIYDTQQASPVCLLSKLHYDEFTDMTWSPDGQCLILSSRDGYCTIIIFDEILPTHHTQQHSLQLQSIAHHNSVPLSYPTPVIPFTGSHMTTPTVPTKRSEPPLTPTASVDDNIPSLATGSSSVVRNKAPEESTTEQEPPKKKRRVALTRVGDLNP